MRGTLVVTLVALMAAPAAAGDVPVAAYDKIGSPASTHIVIKLDTSTAQNCRHSGALRAWPQPTNLISALGRDVESACRRWHATHIRPAYSRAFKNPELASKLGLDRVFIVEVPRGSDTRRMVEEFGQLVAFEKVGLDVIGGKAELIPAGDGFPDQYGMHNTGQAVNGGDPGTPDADIDAPEAWELHTGDTGTVTIAILDTGIFDHAEFTGRRLQGIYLIGECVGGFFDGSRCIEGWAPCADNGGTCQFPTEATDEEGHGTHVAGIAAADGLDGEGVAGVTWGAYILPVQISIDGGSEMSLAANGIIAAVDQGADICNLSFQWYDGDDADQLRNAVDYAHESGVLVVAAAGNGDDCTAPNSDCEVAMPARFANAMAVASTDNNDMPASHSNFGPEIDVAAPGLDVYSTFSPNSWFAPDTYYRYESGTSMAAPHVAGLAALLKSYDPTMTNVELRNRIVNTTDRNIPGWDADNYGTGRINAFSALDRITFMASAAPNGSIIDARQPSDPDGSNVNELNSVLLTFDGDTIDLLPEDLSLVAAPAVGISSVVAADRQVTIFFDAAIPIGTWATLSHVDSPEDIALAHRPGDVDGNATTSIDDVTALISALDGSTQLPARSTDIDRSEATTAADLLRQMDLLIGAETYDPYLDPPPP